jgi:nitroreductase
MKESTMPAAGSMRASTDAPVHELVAKRWSPYAFADKPVSAADLRSLFEAARWAPSSYNEQPWRYIAAAKDQPKEFERLLSCLVEGNQAWARNAPVLALGVYSHALERAGKPNAAAQHDLGLASAQLTLEATARGLHVHQMIGILPDTAREVYAIPPGFSALTGLAIGYAGAPDRLPEALRTRDAQRKPRRPVAETVFSGTWGRPHDFGR